MSNEVTIGKKYGRLTVKDVIKRPKQRTMWLCTCDCGTTKEYYPANVRRGTSLSCGCMQRQQLSERKKTHGGYASKEPLYSVWCGIRKRCLSESCEKFKDYGGRGVLLCEQWHDYSAFREWSMSSGYKTGLSIDRIDVNGNYCPENCRWTDSRTQQNNRRSCVYYTHNGETHTLKEWSRKFGMNYSTVYSRITKYGYTFERALSIS